jgi:tetratricopeptide (TPR) repeat protein
MNKLQVILLASLLFPTGVSQAVCQTENERVEQYLNGLGLDSVTIEHLQQQLDNTIDREARVGIARRLVRLYSKRVFSGPQDSQSEEQFKAIVQLAKDFPEIESDDLKMTVLHSEYANVEQQFLKWVDSGRPNNTQVELAAQFRDIGGRLRGQISQLENSVFEGSDARRFAQANYLYGWVAYYMGVLKVNERQSWMERGDKSFREFLEIDPRKPINQLANDWFEVQSPWHARAQIGLAMCLRGLGKVEQSKFCFKILESVDANSGVRENLDVWRLNSLVYLGEMEQALAFLRRRTADSEQDIQLRTRLWVAAVDAASTCEGGLYSKMGVQFLRFGLHGLASDMNATVLRDVVERESLNLSGEDFLLAWVRGYLDFYRGESTKDPNDFEMARRELNWAINAANSSTDREDLSKCRFLIGWIDFQMQEHSAAVESLRQAIPELMQSDAKLASEAQWLVVKSLQTQARSDPRFANDAFEEMDRLARNFPNSRYVRRVEYEKLLMEVSKFPPDEAIRRLKRIQREDPNYNDAAFQQVVLQHRVWLGLSKTGGSKMVEALGRLLEVEQAYQQLNPIPPNSQRAKAALILIDALIRTGDEKQRLLAKRKIALVQELTQSLDPVSSLPAELRYYKFQLAKVESDFSQIEAQAKWFYEKLPASKYTQSVLVGAAQAAQSRFESIAQLSRNDLVELAWYFERLTNLIGSEIATLQQSQNARYGAAKLAEYQLELGHYEQADELAGKLLEAFPNRKGYWVLHARAKMKLGQFDNALVGWRKIVGSTDPGDDQWYEAKLGIVRSLATKDPLAAKALLLQTVNLSPQRPAEWEAKIEALAKILDVSLDESAEDID